VIKVTTQVITHCIQEAVGGQLDTLYITGCSRKVRTVLQYAFIAAHCAEINA